MNRRIATRAASAAALLTLVTGCAILEPATPAPDAGIPAAWPIPPTTAASGATADIGWRDFFVDERLAGLIGQALENNRDLRVAVLNVERVRAQYRIQRADRVPSLAATGALTRSGGDAPVTDLYTADLGVAGFELDLFGRVRNLSEAALQGYLASEEARRSAQLALVAEVATAWLALAADRESERIAAETLRSYEASLRLTEQRHRLGAVSALDVSQSRTVVEFARAEAARYAGQSAQDVNALAVLVGGAIDPAALPEAFVPEASGLSPLPAGLPAEVLLRRPDIRQAELELRAASASIGAARAAFFPTISLTGSAGTASDELSGLFDAGTRNWLFIPRITVPIFQGGELLAKLDAATASRDIALARYEKSIQSGFRDVADALVLTRTLAEQRSAREAVLAAATRAHELSEARYRAGRDSYLALLDAQRSLYTAQQALLATRFSEQANRVRLYKALGGGWQEGGA